MLQIYALSMIREHIQYQDRVLIFLPNGIDLIEVLFACFEIGAVAV
ncbi:uncharacterized protein METZ01_LOCUS379808, partial [marine metagenome]